MPDKSSFSVARLDYIEGRVPVVTFRLFSKGDETEIQQISGVFFDPLPFAANLMLIVGILLEDYLQTEARALHALIVNEMADKEWAAGRDRDDHPLPF